MNVNVNIDIDDFINEISTSDLVEELSTRRDRNGDIESILDLLKVKGLIKRDLIKRFIENIDYIQESDVELFFKK